jgi:intraflagellar transport protein 122
LVKKLAVYKNRLSVQLPDKLVIYAIDSDDPKDMSYKGKKNISKKFECHLFLITSNNLIFCQDKRIECLNSNGEKLREWLMEYIISFIKVIGGPPSKEAILVGLKSGHVFELFIDSAFPVLLIKHTSPVLSLDISKQRKKLAVIDNNNTLFVYSLETSALLFQEPNANSIAWNSQYEDMLAFSGGGNVSIIVSHFPPHRQRLQVINTFFIIVFFLSF